VTGAVNNAVQIRMALRGTSQRRLAASIHRSPSHVNRLLHALDDFAALLDALGLEVRPRP
jgi:hypothetical protein